MANKDTLPQQKKKFRTRKQAIKSAVKSGALTKQEGYIIQRNLNNRRAVTIYKSKAVGASLDKLWGIVSERDKDHTGKTKINTNMMRRQLLNLELAYLSKPDISMYQQVDRCCKEYFELCIEKNCSWTLAGLCLALGISKPEFFKILNGEKYRSVQTTIQQAYSVLQSQLESDAMSGQINPMIIAYLGNNNFGYSDKKEIKVTTNKTEDLTDKELEEKYIDVEVEEIDNEDNQ